MLVRCIIRRALSVVHVRSSFYVQSPTHVLSSPASSVFVLRLLLSLTFVLSLRSSNTAAVLLSSGSICRIMSSAHKNALYPLASYMMPCTSCQNGKMSHRYHMTSSPTSLGR
ncbi:hypothetical protein BDP81DRAFT_439722 [Colletotrichum phormii]|uniref:Uncharacterized protein n=1 Tax=Colletotrichum phormii TaxID=359342 RepID=A0AAI9ZEP1_9PEZI|nr:uncharacterized protein BDP81DRAFT_439722 [Colletotrichum phormii]KAK1623172.1 hypothetical protein BDP81DRAFT_439722 [Colletotrichum phormii]